MVYKLSLLVIFLLCATAICEAYNVLVIFPVPGKSHTFLGDGIVRHLLAAGHEVTYITPFPKAREQHPLLREIDVSPLQDLMVDAHDMINIKKLMKKETPALRLLDFIKTFLNIHAKALEQDAVKKILIDPKETFDVVIAEWMFNELYSGLAAIYKCPFIWLSTVDLHWGVLRLIDEVTNPAYTSDSISSGVLPFSFVQRVKELMWIIVGHGIRYFYLIGKEHEEYKRVLVPFIQMRGHEVPDFEELRYNSSLILGNSHVSMGSSIRRPQNYIDIGGYHINSNVESLSEDIKGLLDNATNGLIYFSMGSNLRSRDIPTEVKVDLLKMFGKLKQTVIWKFEEDLPNTPSNVHVLKWAPQQRILGHPNCILFITHGGLLSTTETIHFGKPIIGIPAFADQFNNVNRAVNKGFAKRVDLSFTMAAELEKAINDIITDPSYSEKVKMLSLIFHDRPVSPGKELVHWVEHVVRTGGAPHLRSPALSVPWYQKLYLDLAALILVILYLVKFFVKKLYRGLFSSKKRKPKTQ